MGAASDLPRSVREIENAFIPLSDGTRLSARIWLPTDADRDPVPALLEYLPYRKRDNTAERDALTHPYFAGHGYAAVRVDMRGSGESEGILLGEYLAQEQDDALEVIDWLARQPWCSGAVGMIGISWGGFNGLQIAARRPPALKAVISLCSTDDRYADDIHFMGGALLLDKMTWGSRMFTLNTAPPDPALVGERWREMWMQRLKGSGFWIKTWLEHQRRDAFYQHGSVCEDWAAIQCPVYAVGGFADGYSNAVFRLVARLKGPRKGLIGPWAHKYPHFAKPGPQIGFLQECLRWWDHWLKGRNTGIMDEPILRVWMEEPARPQPMYEEKPGRWIAEAIWPAPHLHPQVRVLLPGQLGLANQQGANNVELTISSPQTIGLTAGKWCPYGLVPDLPLDQRAEAGGSLLFDSEPLAAPLEILGAPVLDLTLAADRPNALLAATISEIFPDGAATRVSYGILNLTHCDSHERPEPLVPGRRYHVSLAMNGIAHKFGTGNRVRIALSTSYWPHVWPSPEIVRLTVVAGASRLSLPVRQPDEADKSLRPFGPVEYAPPLRQTTLQPPRSTWTTTFDAFTGETVVRRHSDEGIRVLDAIGLETGTSFEITYRIIADDPLSARLDTVARRHYRRGDWHVGSETHVTMTSNRTHFLLSATLDAFESDKRVFADSWTERVARDLV